MYHSLAIDPQYTVNEYMRCISKYNLLTEEEEKNYVDAWVNKQDVNAAQTIVKSHLRLVVKIAMKFKSYGMQMMDLIAEGNLGLMRAVKNFNPIHKVRICTYADFWIRSAIQKYIINMWSIVRIGTTTAQRKLFYNLKKLQKQFGESTEKIAEFLNVSKKDVEEMHTVMSSRDNSFDLSLFENSESETTYHDVIAKSDSNHEDLIIAKDAERKRNLAIYKALDSLDERSKDIIKSRILRDKPMTLATLSKKYNISAERVRQLTNKALLTMKNQLIDNELIA
ncbi:MAG: RNA polymerase factor sigma-32 [Anaplasmataceae bacterium]|nr:RNA polymerase factor sigma-32 [Anaplasmataceae bacterium]